MNSPQHAAPVEQDVSIGPNSLRGILTVPDRANGLVLFAHGSGSGRLSSRNQAVAHVLQEAGLATLLLDLLSEPEANDRTKVFDIALLAERLQEAADWAASEPAVSGLKIGYFGASTGAAAALVAAARRPELVSAVVSRGGRPDLAEVDLEDVTAPTLLIVGGDDESVAALNRQAFDALSCEKQLVIIPGATHLFPEPGALEEVASLAREWFLAHLGRNAWRAKARTTQPSRHPEVTSPLFHDREDAGRRLAAEFRTLLLREPVVLGIPRGGVATGAALASELGAELDVVLSRKLRAPRHPEYAVGAIGEDGRVYLTPGARQIEGVTDEYLAQERLHQLREIERRQRLFRATHPVSFLKGRTVIVTDDGIATGSTMIAALDVIRAQRPHELIVAVPVAPADRLPSIEARCDRLICLDTPKNFGAVGQFYEDFTQVGDADVVELLRESISVRRPLRSGTALRATNRTIPSDDDCGDGGEPVRVRRKSGRD